MPSGKVMACHPAMLTDTIYAVERHLVNQPLDVNISVPSVAEMVNRLWRGCDTVFSDRIVQKAILELQAMNLVQFEWSLYESVDCNVFNLLAKPKCPEDMESAVNDTFYDGLMGNYSNPTPYGFLCELYELLPTPFSAYGRETVPVWFDQGLYKSRWPIKTTHKMLRELRLMGAINYTPRPIPEIIVLREKNERRITEDMYAYTFGTD